MLVRVTGRSMSYSPNEGLWKHGHNSQSLLKLREEKPTSCNAQDVDGDGRRARGDGDSDCHLNSLLCQHEGKAFTKVASSHGLDSAVQRRVVIPNLGLQDERDDCA